MEHYLMWRLSFPGSGVYTGRTPEEVLRKLSKVQYDPEDRKWIKAALAWRAWILTREIVDTDLDDEAFLVALSATGVAKLEAYEDGRDEWLAF